MQVEWEKQFEKAIEYFQNGYLSESAAELQSLIEETDLAGQFYPQLLESLAIVYTAQSKYKEAEDLFEQILSFPDLADGSCPISFMIHLLNSQAGLYRQWGYYDRAVELYKKALSLVDQSLEALPGEAARLLYLKAHLTCNLGDMFRYQGRLPESESLLLEARTLCQSVGSEHDLETVEHNLALLYLANGQAAKSVEMLRKLLEKASPSRRDLPLMLSNLARANIRCGNFATAERILEQVLRMDELKSDKSAEAAVCNLLAEVYLYLKKYEQAEAMCKKSLAIFEQTTGLTHRLVAPVLVNLACARQEQGLLDGVESLERWALSNLERKPAVPDPELCRIIYQIALNHHARGQYRKSESLYETSIKMHRELFGSEHPGSISIMAHLVLAYFEAGSFSRAKNQLHEAVELIQQIPDSLLAVDSIESLEILADLSCRFQEFRVADELYRRAGNLISAVCEPEMEDAVPGHDDRSISNFAPEESCILPVLTEAVALP
jgi:tetratricopeptide (TPR) repeat protein